jgi:hypothetical protein
MLTTGKMLVICALPFAYSFACADETSPYLSVAALVAPPVVGGILYCFGSYRVLKKFHGKSPKPLPSKFVVWLLFAELSFIGMLCLTSAVASLTHSGIGMCGFYGSGWFMLPLLGAIPVSIVVGYVAARRLPQWLNRMTAA